MELLQDKPVSVTSQIEQRQLRFYNKLKTFRELQETYMPGALQKIREEENRRDLDSPVTQPENVKLWIPSDLSKSERKTGCKKGLASKELQLRRAQCDDALKQVSSSF